MTVNEDRFGRVEEKVDNLVSVVHANHLDLVERIENLRSSQAEKLHELDSKVQKHDNHFDFVNKFLFGSSGILTLWFLVKDHLPK